MTTNLKLTKQDLEKAVAAGVINESQVIHLWSFLEQNQKSGLKLRSSQILYYLGGVLALSAVTIFLDHSFNDLQGYPLLLISSVSLIISMASMHYLWKLKQVNVATILAVFNVIMVTLVVYNLQQIFHFLPPAITNYGQFQLHYQLNYYWLPMEFSALLLALAIFYFYKLNFLQALIIAILCYLGMDAIQLLCKLDSFDLLLRSYFLLCFGVIQLSIIIKIDYKLNAEDADKLFWLYISGVIIFWLGLSGINDSSSWHRRQIIYLVANLGMLLASIIVQRRIFAICAVVGIIWSISSLTTANKLLPLILITLGIIIIIIGIKWAAIEDKFLAKYARFVPNRFRQG